MVKPLIRGPPRPFLGSKPHDRINHVNSRLSSNLSSNLRSSFIIKPIF